ncbi:L-rhamnose-binding lectin CSL2-like isoform X2 [Xyrauchen texanus]|uniref:L-rhamnose-binding lectin CSL2-like isoform X2 n=1 Tax=Xyrauchen texanus TaxID=154827 RepID=UPI002241B0BE|nr:L-rhamnose-binding lectin CSL2-like isoform X2 [Xyrauchen texanus]
MLSLNVTLLTFLLLNSRLLISAVITCDGDVQHLRCDTGVISVQSAYFGHTSRNICSVGQNTNETSNMTCTMSVSIITKRCNGLRECEINTQGLTEKDPCIETYKYYTTNYICIPAKKSVTCPGGYSYLNCEYGRIQINTANYGRTDKITCSEGHPLNQTQNTNSYSPNALYPVAKRWFRCNGQRSCEVFSTHTVFTDLCFGTYKYLTVSYFCLPSPIRSVVICEHQENILGCEEGTRIHIDSANYGRTDSSTCSAGRPATQLVKTDCYAGNSLAIVAKECEDKDSCSIRASNDVFLDPCYGTFKYLYITYSCAAV